uniref:Methenyltetrahydrofolate cyclohydrolase n=1 Tax=Desulfatirhabdium butyrativorans TaxID=340467 RepID=A0A7C4VSG8_9BACT
MEIQIERPMMLANQTIQAFLEKTASGEPVPGGGSAAALNAALAAALVEMVARLTIGKKGFEAVQPRMQDIAEVCKELRDTLLFDIDRDSDAYTQVLAAYRLPKGTEEERDHRKAAIQKAFRTAASVPRDVAEKALRIMQLAGEVIRNGNPNAASDGAAGMLAARMAALTALYNVRINLPSVEDAQWCSDMRDAAARMEDEVHSLEAAITPSIPIP